MSLLNRVLDKLGHLFDVQFRHDVGPVVLDGLGTDEQDFRDFFSRLSFADQSQHLPFSRRQGVNRKSPLTAAEPGPTFPCLF